MKNQEEGVPKGSVLSVTLFSIKINNITKCLSPGVDGSLYEDDLLICYRSKYIHASGGACGVMVIVVGIGHDDTSSNPGRD